MEFETVEKPSIRPDLKSQRTHDQAFEVISDRKVEFTKEFAEKVIVMDTFSGDRPLRDTHINFLVSEAKAGNFQFELASIVTASCDYDGKERRLNGQHTAWMRVYMPDSWNHQIRHLRYRVRTEEELRRLYCTIDRNAPRTASNIVVARLVGTKEYDGVSANVLKLLEQGLRFYLDESHIRVDQVLDLMLKDYLDVARKVARLIEQYGITASKHMKRAAVIGAMFATLKKAENDSFDFWGRVATGTDLSRSMPEWHLFWFLNNSSPNNGRGASADNDRAKVSSEDIYGRCMSAWNCFRDKRNMELLKSVHGRNGSRAAAK